MNEEFAEAGAPQLGGMGVSMAGPTIIVHGTEEQKAEHLPKILAARRSGARASASPAPAPTSPRCRPAPCVTATTT